MLNKFYKHAILIITLVNVTFSPIFGIEKYDYQKITSEIDNQIADLIGTIMGYTVFHPTLNMKEPLMGVGKNGCSLLIFNNDQKSTVSISLNEFQNPKRAYVNGNHSIKFMPANNAPNGTLPLSMFFPNDTSKKEGNILAKKISSLMQSCRIKNRILIRKAHQFSKNNSEMKGCDATHQEEVTSFINPFAPDFTKFITYIDMANMKNINDDVDNFADNINAFFPNQHRLSTNHYEKMLNSLTRYPQIMVREDTKWFNYFSFFYAAKDIVDTKIKNQLESLKPEIEALNNIAVGCSLDGCDGVTFSIKKKIKKSLLTSTPFLNKQMIDKLIKDIISKNTLRFSLQEKTSLLYDLVSHKYIKYGHNHIPNINDGPILNTLLKRKTSNSFSVLAIDRVRKMSDEGNHRTVAHKMLMHITRKYAEGEWDVSPDHIPFLTKHPEILRNIKQKYFYHLLPVSKKYPPKTKELIFLWQKQRNILKSKWLGTVALGHDNDIDTALNVDFDHLNTSALESLKIILEDEDNNFSSTDLEDFNLVIKTLLPQSMNSDIDKELSHLFSDKGPTFLNYIESQKLKAEQLFWEIFETKEFTTDHFFEYFKFENHLRNLNTVLYSQIAFIEDPHSGLGEDQMKEILLTLKEIHFRSIVVFRWFKKHVKNWEDIFKKSRDEDRAESRTEGRDFDNYGRYGGIGGPLDEAYKYEKEIESVYPQRNQLRNQVLQEFDSRVEELAQIRTDDPSLRMSKLIEFAKNRVVIPEDSEIPGPSSNLFTELSMFRVAFRDGL